MLSLNVILFPVFMLRVNRAYDFTVFVKLVENPTDGISDHIDML